ncbi:zinc-binding dehydrogenase [Actinacidiphila acididurans]|uniref:Zinc-binding dehydrogenase n=1 Tax=Actinacidiphila acididurans TaxID=2784346 RepID=A0ABS2TXA7_9ACTN|nr:zinc-binding dehydrogenase [Actinacidiphila acididurans]MBM9507717.1 zinc-binding dehydrogenase [Actinacidiphila acididurans]
MVNSPDAGAPITITEVADPQPAPHQVLVKVHAFSVNRGELALLRVRPAGWRPGQDIAGVVVQEAADGSGPKAGTRIVGMVEGAGWSEQAAVDTGRLAALPDDLDFPEAAGLPMAGLTALRSLRQGGFLVGRRVLITGANGGVGRFQVQLAALAGAEVTAVSTRAEAAQDLLDLGASAVVSKTSEAEGLFHLIEESVGGASLEAAITKIVPGGTVVVLGNSSAEQAGIGVLDFVGGHEGARLQNYISYASTDPDDEDLRILAGLVGAGKLVSSVGRTADWSDLVTVLGEFRDRKVPGGKVVLTIG